MPIITISHEAQLAIRGAATNPFNQTGTQRPDGSWDVPVEQDTLDRIHEAQLAGETLSDTIIRVVLTANRKPN